ncbi:hypothetical protein, partial [Klebsiella michiganensis]|uniref:hypothetical protein n=1 Tax=Klebsiella michiganensis TaxID=1134687 RepID=UPI001C5CDA1B
IGSQYFHEDSWRIVIIRKSGCGETGPQKGIYITIIRRNCIMAETEAHPCATEYRPRRLIRSLFIRRLKPRDLQEQASTQLFDGIGKKHCRRYRKREIIRFIYKLAC